MTERLGYNDEDGTAHCGLCDWSRKCRNMEEIELFLQKHLEEEHGRFLGYRVDVDTQKQVTIPTIRGN